MTSQLEVTDDGGTSWKSVTTPPGRPAGLDVLDCPTSTLCDLMWTSSTKVRTEAFGTVSMLSIAESGTVSSSTALPAPSRSGKFQSFSLACTDVLHCLATTSVAYSKGKPQPYSFSTVDGGVTWSSAINVLGRRMKLQLGVGKLECERAGTCWAIGGEQHPTDFKIVETHDLGKTWKLVTFASVPINKIDAAYP